MNSKSSVNACFKIIYDFYFIQPKSRVRRNEKNICIIIKIIFSHTRLSE